MKQAKRIIGLVAGMGLALGISMAPVQAATKSGTMEISCDGTSVKTGLSITQVSAGAFKIKQNSATESSKTKFSARSANGNDLPFKTASTGSTVSWAGVLPSTYKVRGMRSGSKNCNGIFPGKGTYKVTYTATSTN